MFDLFNQPPQNISLESRQPNNDSIEKIKGLIYIPNFVSREEELCLIDSIDSEPWLTEIKRKVQHYGYKYDYRLRGIDYSMFMGPLPSWASSYAESLFAHSYISEVPDQMIVNEYLPGQGIANHIDCEPCFGDTIISMSLNSSCVMEFINLGTKEKKQIQLEQRSLVVLSGEARYEWTHGIPQRKKDVVNGDVFLRRRRISLTFRKVRIK